MSTHPILSHAQAKFWDAYRELCLELKYLPTNRELCQATGLRSSSTVNTHLANLRSLGLPAYTRGQSKSMEHRKKVFEAVAALQSSGEIDTNFLFRSTEETRLANELEDAKALIASQVRQISALKEKAAAAEWNLGLVRAWIEKTDRVAGVDRTWPHEWKKPAGDRLGLMVAAGEVSA